MYNGGELLFYKEINMPEKMSDLPKCHDFKPGDTILFDTSKIKDFDPRNLEANRYDWRYNRFCKEVKTQDVDDEGSPPFGKPSPDYILFYVNIAHKKGMV